MEPVIRADRIGFAYNGRMLFEDFDLALESGSVTALLGPSGIGKSTLARMLAGDESPTSGFVRRGSSLDGASSAAYVDQDPMNSVFPWQTVRKNIEYPLRTLGWPEPVLRQRAKYIASQLRLDKYFDTFPAQLSGGELQRLALARALSWRPRFVVIDETLGSLDRPLRDDVLSSLRRLTAEDSTTVLVITHSIPDVVKVATRCIVLGKRPVRIVSDLAIEAAFPRDEHTPDLRRVEDILLEGLRHGTLD